MTYVDWYKNVRLQEWRTPPELFDPLHAEFRFDLDGAADAENGLLPCVSTPDAPVEWGGRRVFCNPPWSAIPPFVELAAAADVAVLLVPARTNCRWFHRALELGAAVRYFKPKPRFVRPDGTRAANSPVDCVLLVFGGPS